MEFLLKKGFNGIGHVFIKIPNEEISSSGVVSFLLEDKVSSVLDELKKEYSDIILKNYFIVNVPGLSLDNICVIVEVSFSGECLSKTDDILEKIKKEEFIFSEPLVSMDNIKQYMLDNHLFYDEILDEGETVKENDVVFVKIGGMSLLLKKDFVTPFVGKRIGDEVSLSYENLPDPTIVFHFMNELRNEEKIKGFIYKIERFNIEADINEPEFYAARGGFLAEKKEALEVLRENIILQQKAEIDNFNEKKLKEEIVRVGDFIINKDNFIEMFLLGMRAILEKYLVVDINILIKEENFLRNFGETAIKLFKDIYSQNIFYIFLTKFLQERTIDREEVEKELVNQVYEEAEKRKIQLKEYVKDMQDADWERFLQSSQFEVAKRKILEIIKDEINKSRVTEEREFSNKTTKNINIIKNGGVLLNYGNMSSKDTEKS